jgi:ADP-ribose diphosphatase
MILVVEAADWTNVVTIRPDDQVVLIKQCRHATKAIILEIPVGTVSPGEFPIESGKQESIEETRHASDDWFCIGKVYPNPEI